MTDMKIKRNELRKYGVKTQTGRLIKFKDDNFEIENI